MTTIACVRRSLMLAAALTILPALAQSQKVSSAQPGPTADELEARAAALHEQPARYAEAARLYKRAAQLRGEHDPLALKDLRMAAYLFGYSNQLFDARKTMESVAERALARGDVWRASTAKLEAAFFAFKAGDNKQAQRLGQSALLLAESPLLSSQQRGSIVNRLRADPGLAALVD